MDEPGESRDREQQPLFAPSRRRRDGGMGLFAGTLVAILLVLGGVGSWLWLRSDTEPDAGTPAAEAGDLPPVRAEPPDGGAAPAADSALDLPPLDASDAFIRDLVAGLSERPSWARWLVTDDLARRFVEAVVRVSAGSSPAPVLEEVEEMEPDAGFRVARSEGGLVIDPASYRRYDLHAATIASLDTDGTARLYRQLRPLFREAHRELGLVDESFEETLARALGTLLAVEVPEGPIEVQPEDGTYVFADPALESLSPAAKHLVRMGPENTSLVQAKLRELADAIGVRPLPPRERPAGVGGA